MKASLETHAPQGITFHHSVADVRWGEPSGLVLAATGGHNQEMHNQNDIGTIIVNLAGESVVADPGRGRYTRTYFGPDRYTHFVTTSEAHSVPVVNALRMARQT